MRLLAIVGLLAQLASVPAPAVPVRFFNLGVVFASAPQVVAVTSTPTCVLAVDKPTIAATGSDVATLSLTMNGAPLTQPMTVVELRSGTTKPGVVFPLQVASQQPGTWILAIQPPAPMGTLSCNPVTVTAQ